MLNLAGEPGMQSIAIEQVLAVAFPQSGAGQRISAGPARAGLVARHAEEDRQPRLLRRGQTHRASVGYVVEHPIWKTSYRLRIEHNGKLFIQGWAIVENTSDDDWNDVHMVLVSGRPISFKMNLYEPLYIPRPTVEPELFASLRPPVYSGAHDLARSKDGRRGPPLGFVSQNQIWRLHLRCQARPSARL